LLVNPFDLGLTPEANGFVSISKAGWEKKGDDCLLPGLEGTPVFDFNICPSLADILCYALGFMLISRGKYLSDKLTINPNVSSPFVNTGHELAVFPWCLVWVMR
jgi:hypothetical protein